MTSRDEVRHPASFRDPSGFVFQQDGRIRRAVTAYGLDKARAVRATGLLDALIADGLLLAEQEVATSMAGRPDGIGGEDVVRMLRLPDKLRWNVLVNVVLPERLQRRAATASMDATVRKGHLSRAALREMWSSLRRWIARLQPKGTGSTTWGRYDETVPEGEVAAISAFVSQFVERVQPQLLWDLGCNAGRYSEVALGAGAGFVVGIDSDAGVADKAFARARDQQLRLLPLLVDLLNPTPTQGWQERERDNLLGRGSGDALLAVAVVHHLAARNAPLGEIIELLTAIAPEGVIGFVPRTDARARQLFSARDDLFASYTLENFVALLRGRARIVRQEVLPGSERVLIWF